jgi:hypothetical protein
LWFSNVYAHDYMFVVWVRSCVLWLIFRWWYAPMEYANSHKLCKMPRKQALICYYNWIVLSNCSIW